MQIKVDVVPDPAFATQEPDDSVYPVGQAVVCNIEIEPDEFPPDIFILEPEPDNVNEPVSVSEQTPPDKV